MRGMRTRFIIAASALAVLSLATVASAQPGGPGGGGPGGGFGGPGGGRGGFGQGNGSRLLSLTEDGAVWDDIKITDEQLGKVTRLSDSVDNQSRKTRDSLRAQAGAAPDGQPVDPAAAREAARQAMAESASALKQDAESALRKILKPAQFSRVQQIELQEAGELVVARPDVAYALNLSPDQIEGIQNVIDQMNQGQDQLNTARREMFASMGGGRGGIGGGRGNNNNANTPPLSDAEQQARREQMQLAMEKMRTDTQSNKDKAIAMISKLLTKAQKAKYKTMLGKPFDLASLNNGRGPNNGFGPGGPGGGPGGRGGPAAPTAAANGAAQPKAAALTGTAGTTKAAASTGTAGTTKGAATTKRRPGA